MKNTHLLLSPVLILINLLCLASCSSTSNNDEKDALNNPNQVDLPDSNTDSDSSNDYRFIKNLYYEDHNGSVTRVFEYKNEFLVKDFDLFLIQLEYGTENKIINQKYCRAEDITPTNIQEQSCSEFIRAQSYNYSNGMLSSFLSQEINDNQEVFDSHQIILSYDDIGNITSEVYNIDGLQNHYYAYNDNGNILTHRVEYLPENSSYTLTYEFDNKFNPLYPLWKEFGYYREPWDDDTILTPMFLEHNVTKVFNNGQLTLEVKYTYDDDDYPVFAAFTRYFINAGTSRNGSVTYEYLN
ncbi:hypothetical protein [Maribacter luteus]|uniref:DUF4595 domain-containing protein n=1 Tax=Maribacter luteus TaxID=2594478 RepID=A0A6I2MQ70_9FLAO|nr:hypothetical protein [Maribacter luteus]MRX64374.1 hypothetical protein [Maribacter luteus]